MVVAGGLEEEIQVELDERQMANLGLESDRVLNRLAQENINVTGGRLKEGQTEFLVRTINEFVRPEDMLPIVIDSSRGAIVRLEDVATGSSRTQGPRVDHTHRRSGIGRGRDLQGRWNEHGAGLRSGQAGRSRGAARKILRKVEPRPAPGGDHRSGALHPRSRSPRYCAPPCGAAGLAILVLFLFLRSWKTTSIIGVAIPISVVATFFLMFVFDVSLNIMSLGGLTLGNRPARGQLDRGAGGDPTKTRSGSGRPERGARGRRWGLPRRDRQHVDHDLRVRPDRIRRGCRRAAVRRSGADGDVLADRFPARGVDRHPDARLAAFRFSGQP